MPRHENAGDELFACAWCTQRVRRRLTETGKQAAFACPMCGRPMYPLPAAFLQMASPAPGPDVAAPRAEALSRA